MRIATNTTSFSVWTSYTKNLGNLQSSMGKLSTGTISNTDDPAGVGIADRMQAQIGSTEQAYKNTENTVSLLQTADAWLSQVNDNLSRMKQLSVAANGISSDDDVKNLQTEYSSLQEEITRITSRYTAAAKFNGLYLFRGGDGVAVVTGDSVDTSKTISVQIGADIDQKIDLDLSDLQVTNNEIIGTVHTYSYGAGDVAAEKLAAARAVFETYRTQGVAYAVSQGVSQANAETQIDNGIDALANGVANGDPQGLLGSGAAYDCYMAINTDSFGGSFALDSQMTNFLLFNQVRGSGVDWQAGDASTVYSDAVAAYAAAGQSGDNTLVGSTHTAVTWASIIDTNLMSVSSNNAIGALDQAINFVASARASMGAQQSRVEKTSSALLTYQDNLESAKSKVSDIDMAQETTKYSTFNVLTQSANAMLAQANQLPASLVLSLIQG